jgi:CHAT domain-containing protein
MKPRQLLLLLSLCLVLPASALQAQEDTEALARAADDSATTVEARQQALLTLLVEAEQLRNAGDSLAAARALNRAGRFQLKLSLSQEALTTFQEASDILTQTPGSPTNIDSLNGMGLAYTRLSRCVDAKNSLQQAIALSVQNNYPAGRAEALLTRSNCENYEDHSLALRTAREALAIWTSTGNKRGIAQSYAAIGHYEFALNNLMEATASYEAALNLWRELNVADEQAAALILLGFIEFRKGEWQNVFAYLMQAQGLIDEKAEPFRMGQISAGLAETFNESGMPANGLVKYRQALEYYRLTGNPRNVTVMNWGIGRTQYILGHYTEALETLRRALAEAEALKELTIVAMCNDYLGRTFGALNDHDAALRHFALALDLYTRVANPMEAARTRVLMGQVYQQQGKIEKAREHYLTGLETFRKLSDRVNQSATLYALGSLELKQNNLETAENYLSQSIKFTEDMRRVSTSHDLMAAFSARVYERYENYIECLMRKHDAQPAQNLNVFAFETSELARARSLAELLRATQTSLMPGLDAQLAEQEKLLRQSLRLKEDSKVTLLGTTYKKEELDALDAELARLEAEYKRVIAAIRERYPSYEQITRPVAWDLRKIQEQVIVDDQTVLLEYSLGAERSYVWVVTRGDFKSYELPAQARIEEAAQKVYKSLTTAPGIDQADEFTPAAQALSQLILSPVAAELKKRRIIVVADGALNYIPFQVLSATSAADEPLVANYEIINAPSASILGELRQETARRQAPAKLLAAFGNPVFAENYELSKGTQGDKHLIAGLAMETARWQHALRDIELNGDAFDPSVIKPLFYAKRELDNLRDIATADETFLAADFAATREQLLGTDLTQYAILHFATHGLLDSKKPEYSGLVLSTVSRGGQAQNGFIGLREIYELRAPVELVVLSACQTALGQDVRGEGLIGLTRGFMHAGASSVVASLWKVNDSATAELMRQFYANMLQKGMTPAEALRAAQNSIRQTTRWRSPYYWAAFTLQGDNRRIIKPTTVVAAATLYPKIIMGAAVLMLLAGGAWWYRRRRLQTARANG